jgi:hypothetical protein
MATRTDLDAARSVRQRLSRGVCKFAYAGFLICICKIERRADQVMYPTPLWYKTRYVAHHP